MEIYGITDLFLDCCLESLVLVSYDRNVCFIDTWMNRSHKLPKRLPSKEIFITEDDGESEIGVFDLLGKVIIPLKKVTLMEGFNQISINTTNLVAGKYIVQLIYQEEIYSYSLIIHNR